MRNNADSACHSGSWQRLLPVQLQVGEICVGAAAARRGWPLGEALSLAQADEERLTHDARSQTW